MGSEIPNRSLIMQTGNIKGIKKKVSRLVQGAIHVDAQRALIGDDGDVLPPPFEERLGEDPRRPVRRPVRAAQGSTIVPLDGRIIADDLDMVA